MLSTDVLINIFMYFKPLQFNNTSYITQILFNHYNHLLNETSLYTKIVDYQTIRHLVPDLITQLENIGCYWDIARIVSAPPNFRGEIHIDGSEEFPKHSAINWPVANYNHSKTTWYNTSDHAKFYYFNPDRFHGSGDIKCYRSEHCEAIESTTINQPHLIRIDVPHNVVNHNNKTRIMLSMRFNPEPLHLWEQE